MRGTKSGKIQGFDFEAGELINGRYEIISKIGEGWEGEVYLVEEVATGIERAAKFFFPHRNVREKTSRLYAQKVHKLHTCPAVVQYHSYETVTHFDQQVAFLVSEFVEGKPLSIFLQEHPGKRISDFEALHLLYSLTLAIEDIHRKGEYHGDIHSGNIIVEQYGLRFGLKILDFFHYLGQKNESKKDDILGCIHIYHEALGGAKTYAKHDPYVKEIICGLKGSLIIHKFPNITRLRLYLENLHLELS